MTDAFDDMRLYLKEPLTGVLKRRIKREDGYRGGYHAPSSIPEFIFATRSRST